MQISKRTALAAAVVTVAALAACSSADADPAATAPAPPTAAPTASAEPTPAVVPSPLPERDPASVDEYVDRFSYSAEDYADSEWLDNGGVEAEFREAAVAFPFELPERYWWPETSWLASSSDPARSEPGSGVVQAYFFWQMATATAAYADHLRGDEAAASDHLAALADGYASPVRSMYLDPEQPGTESSYYQGVIETAMQGDWDALVEVEVDLFLGNDAYRAIAAEAGDAAVIDDAR